MENSYDYEGHSSCGCKGIFCCIFPSSRDSKHERDAPEISYLNTEEKSRQVVNPNYYSGYDKRTNSEVNKAFSEYISHAKVKIRATSNVGRDDIEIVYSKSDDARDSEKKLADANDMFSDYITRAKLKIRKTSSIGSKRMISFRK